MKNLDLKNAIISACIIWVLGVTAYVTSYFIPIMSDTEAQANWALSIALIPSALIGAHIYYQKGYSTNGFVLGIFMFLIAMILDAVITVPFLIMPYGGDHISFFANPGFWVIAVEYISVVAAYRPLMRLTKTVDNFRIVHPK